MSNLPPFSEVKERVTGSMREATENLQLANKLEDEIDEVLADVPLQQQAATLDNAHTRHEFFRDFTAASIAQAREEQSESRANAEEIKKVKAATEIQRRELERITRQRAERELDEEWDMIMETKETLLAQPRMMAILSEDRPFIKELFEKIDTRHKAVEEKLRRIGEDIAAAEDSVVKRTNEHLEGDFSVRLSKAIGIIRDQYDQSRQNAAALRADWNSSTLAKDEEIKRLKNDLAVATRNESSLRVQLVAAEKDQRIVAEDTEEMETLASTKQHLERANKRLTDELDFTKQMWEVSERRINALELLHKEDKDYIDLLKSRHKTSR